MIWTWALSAGIFGGCAPTPGDSAAADEAPPAYVAPSDSEPEATPATTAVVLNELSADNAGWVVDETGATADWIELYNTGDATADLGGFGLSDDWTEPLLHALPEGTTLAPKAHLLLWADGLPELGDSHLGFRLSESGEGVGLFAPDGSSVDWVTFAEMAPDAAWARLPDGIDYWEMLERGTPGAENQLLVLAQVEVLSAGATWAYWDRGVEPEGDWTAPDFDDSAWPTGPAPLGYGDDQTTVIDYGDDSADKHVTAWFRARFTLDEPGAAGASGASIGLRCDDGAVVYLNGVELHRRNMADGAVTPDTLANATTYDDEEVYYESSVATDALVAGENVLAVELHQVSVDSSDATLDLWLSLESYAPAR